MSQVDEQKTTPQVGDASEDSWLTRPATIRKLWWAFGCVLALTVLAQVFIPVKGEFPLESSFGFAAWYGFGCCVLMVLVARVLGWWLKRPENYYTEADPTTGADTSTGSSPQDKEGGND